MSPALAQLFPIPQLQFVVATATAVVSAKVAVAPSCVAEPADPRPAFYQTQASPPDPLAEGPEEDEPPGEGEGDEDEWRLLDSKLLLPLLLSLLLLAEAAAAAAAAFVDDVAAAAEEEDEFVAGGGVVVEDGDDNAADAAVAVVVDSGGGVLVGVVEVEDSCGCCCCCSRLLSKLKMMSPFCFGLVVPVGLEEEGGVEVLAWPPLPPPPGEPLVLRWPITLLPPPQMEEVAATLSREVLRCCRRCIARLSPEDRSGVVMSLRSPTADLW